MKKYSDSTIYVSAYAKLPVDMPSGGVYGALDVGLIIDCKTDIIQDVSITLLTDEAKAFLKDIVVGAPFGETDIDKLINEIKGHFFGMSQKAFCVNLRLIHEKYLKHKMERMAK